MEEGGSGEMGDVNAAIRDLLAQAHRSAARPASALPPGPQKDELRVKLEYMGEKRSILVSRPLLLSTLVGKIREMYGRHLTIYYTVHNSEIIVPMRSQDDLEKALSLISKSTHMRSLRLLLSKHAEAEASPDSTTTAPAASSSQSAADGRDSATDGRFSPPPGTSVSSRRKFSAASSRYSRTSSKRSEGEFIPESLAQEVPYRSSASSRASSRLSADACSNCSFPDPGGYRGLGRLGSSSTSWRARHAAREGSRASSSSSSGLVPDVGGPHSPAQPQTASLASPQAPSNWRQGRCLGTGAYGSVFLCYDADTSKELAVKRVAMRANVHNHHALKKEIASLENEIRLLKNLEHERIVQYLGFSRHEDSVCIFMEYMAGGSVRDEVRTYGPLQEPVVLKYARQILQGLVYLHHYDIVHRDIKCANILRDGAGNVKIGDFGSGKRLQTICSQSAALTFIGTPYYMAPEVISGSRYGRSADLWSLGCSLVEMLSGSPPWRELEPMAAIFRIVVDAPDLDEALPDDTSAALRALLDGLFQREPSRRPRARDALQLPLLQLPPSLCG